MNNLSSSRSLRSRQGCDFLCTLMYSRVISVTRFKKDNKSRINTQSNAIAEEPACPCRRGKRRGLNPWVGKIPWRRKWQPTPVFLPGESHGQRSLAGYSPWGGKESGMAEQLTLSLSSLFCYLVCPPAPKLAMK